MNDDYFSQNNNNNNEENQQQPQQPQQPAFRTPHVTFTDPTTEVMSTKDWIITMLIMMIPCVNFVMMFVWAFGNGNQNRKNYFRATLIFMLISIGVFVVLSLLGAGMFFSAMMDIL